MKVRTAKHVLQTLESSRLSHRILHRPGTIREALSLMSRFPAVVDRMACRPHGVRLWGQNSVVRPVLVHQRFGDGAYWGTLSPMNSRPEYYLVMGDSSWHNDAVFDDALDTDIFPAIEEQYGSSDCYCDECGKSYYDEDNQCCAGERWWPALDTEGIGWCFPCYETNHYRLRKAGRRWRRRYKKV